MKSKHVFVVTLFLAVIFPLTILLISEYSYFSDHPASSPSQDFSTALVDEAVKALQWGNIAFYAPALIQLEDSEIVELLISPRKSIQQLQLELNFKEGIEAARVKLSNRMKANLSGSGFNILNILPDEQAVLSDSTTSWKWEVTPIKAGTQHLNLSMSADINVAGRDAPIIIQTYRKSIEVSVSPVTRVSRLLNFLSSNWEWFWVAILFPVATFLWQKYRKNKPKHR